MTDCSRRSQRHASGNINLSVCAINIRYHASTKLNSIHLNSFKYTVIAHIVEYRTSIIFFHLKLGIALAIPATNERKNTAGYLRTQRVKYMNCEHGENVSMIYSINHILITSHSMWQPYPTNTWGTVCCRTFQQ